MNISKRSVFYLLATVIFLANFARGTDWAPDVLLHNEKNEYLTVAGDRATFTPDKTKATRFISYEAPNPTGLIGVIRRNFSFNNRYLHADLSLRKKAPIVCWTAPVHYLYSNYFSSGDQKLIAEDIP